MKGFAFVLHLAQVLGGLGFALVLAVVLLVGGIYLVATGHPSDGCAIAGASVLTGHVAMALVSVAVLRVKSRGGVDGEIGTA